MFSMCNDAEMSDHPTDNACQNVFSTSLLAKRPSLLCLPVQICDKKKPLSHFPITHINTKIYSFKVDNSFFVVVDNTLLRPRRIRNSNRLPLNADALRPNVLQNVLQDKSDTFDASGNW